MPVREVRAHDEAHVPHLADAAVPQLRSVVAQRRPPAVRVAEQHAIAERGESGRTGRVYTERLLGQDRAFLRLRNAEDLIYVEAGRRSHHHTTPGAIAYGALEIREPGRYCTRRSGLVDSILARVEAAHAAAEISQISRVTLAGRTGSDDQDVSAHGLSEGARQPLVLIGVEAAIDDDRGPRAREALESRAEAVDAVHIGRL
jgi:hypothetical protein